MDLVKALSSQYMKAELPEMRVTWRNPEYIETRETLME